MRGRIALLKHFVRNRWNTLVPFRDSLRSAYASARRCFFPCVYGKDLGSVLLAGMKMSKIAQRLLAIPLLPARECAFGSEASFSRRD